MYFRYRVLSFSIWVFRNSLAILEDYVTNNLGKKRDKVEHGNIIYSTVI
jgi:hypothetical protein